MSKLTILLCVAVGLAGCGSSGGAIYGGTVSGSVSYAYEPPLAEIGTDVWVVEGYDQPVFYTDNSYWLYREGNWYRSPYYDRGWTVVYSYNLPARVRRIDRPFAYVRYRAQPGARWRRGPRGAVVVRDYRDNGAVGARDRRDGRYDNRSPGARYVDEQRRFDEARDRQEQDRLRAQREQQARLERDRQRQDQLEQQLRASRQQEADRRERDRQQMMDQRQQDQRDRVEQRQQERRDQVEPRQDRRDQIQRQPGDQRPRDQRAKRPRPQNPNNQGKQDDRKRKHDRGD